MGERDNLSPAEARRLAELIFEFVKSRGGAESKFADLNRNQTKGRMISRLGLHGGHLNASEWETAWQAVASFEGVISSGCGTRICYKYRQPKKEPVKATMTILNKLTREQGVQATQALIDLVYEKGCIGKTAARKVIAELFNATDIDFHAWGPVIKSATGRKQPRRIEQDGQNYIPAKPQPESPVASPEPKVVARKKSGVPLKGVTTVWDGEEPLQLEGDLEIVAEGPFGKIKLQVKKLIITLLSVIGM